MMKRIISKNLFCFFALAIMYFFIITNVCAETITIENVSKQFDQSTLVQGMSELGSTIFSKVNTADKTLDIYEENEKIFSFQYGDDYLEYNNRSAVVTQENCMDMVTVFSIQGIVESLFVLSGHENKSLSEDATYTDTYDEYGIQLETESYNFSGEDENGSWNMSGEFLKYFKISLDTDKLEALISKYGVELEEQEPNKEEFADLIPTLEVKDITENSVSISTKVDYSSADTDDSVMCRIYRSESENSSYEMIMAMECSKLEGVTGFIIDKGLKSNTTYYYKAIVDGGINYSDPISVTTKGSSTVTDNSTNSNPNNNNVNNNNTQDNVIENPNTGSGFKYNIFIIFMILSSAFYMLIRKRSRFPKHN